LDRQLASLALPGQDGDLGAAFLLSARFADARQRNFSTGMKMLFDFLPIVLFYIAYKLADLYVATEVLIVAALAQTGWLWLRQRRVSKLLLVVDCLTLILGGTTLVLHDPIFLKWKPTVVNWLFAIILTASCLIGQKTLLERMLGDQVELPSPIWVKLTFAWALFCLIISLANLYVAFTFAESTWVNFKTLGILGLTLVFALAQAAYMSRHLKIDDTPSKES
jgi:intracellular septation protein